MASQPCRTTPAHAAGGPHVLLEPVRARSQHLVRRRRAAAIGCLALAATLLTACSEPAGPQTSVEPSTQAPTSTTSARPKPVQLPKGNPTFADVIPAPRSAKPDGGENFLLDDTVSVRHAGRPARDAAEYLLHELQPATGFQPDPAGGGKLVMLQISPEDGLGPQGYRLEVRREQVTVTATDRAGLFNGVQTLLQLLPADVESDDPVNRQWVLPGGVIEDRPRFGYRGTMLDVARHFFDAGTVKRHIDRIARYKINYLHLHLADDQGWRLQIDRWPKLTSVGGRTEVGGGPGGFYTKEEYASIVRYAEARGVTVVPEIDMPGHTNAALASYPELNCDGKAPPPYTDTQVGFSTLCVDKPQTYEFVRDVIAEVAELTPGPYLHIGGDEAQSTSSADYGKFLGKVLPMVVQAGKRPVGWHEYAQADLPPEAVVQYWRIETADKATAAAAARGHKVLMSPANKSYLDMKYVPGNPWGNKWAGPVSVRTAYDWDPAGFLDGITEQHVLGVETPLWTELVESEDDLERMAFPRIAAIAEVGWSPQDARSWGGFAERLAKQGPRMARQGVSFHPSPEIPW